MRPKARRNSFAIIDRLNGFAAAMFLDREGETGRLSYWVGRPFWGQGIATAAIRQQLRFLQMQSVLARVVATVYQGNVTSRRVLEKCGFVAIGTERAGQAGALRYQLDL